MGNLIEQFTHAQEIAVLGECVSTRNLLGYGVKILRAGTIIETTRDPLLTTLSIGVEKLHKLALGAISVADTGSWPSKAAMMEWGHGSAEMHRVLMGELLARTADSSDYGRAAVSTVTESPVAAALILALDTYGKYGRFHYLDILAEKDPRWIGPEDAWTEVENATSCDPEMAARKLVAVTDLTTSDTLDLYLVEVNERIAQVVEAVWRVVCTTGKQGVMGRCGVVLGSELEPEMVGRQS